MLTLNGLSWEYRRAPYPSASVIAAEKNRPWLGSALLTGAGVVARSARRLWVTHTDRVPRFLYRYNR